MAHFLRERGDGTLIAKRVIKMAGTSFYSTTGPPGLWIVLISVGAWLGILGIVVAYQSVIP